MGWSKFFTVHYGWYKEKFDEEELPEHKKCTGSTVFQVILNSDGGYAERICYLEQFVVKVYSSILGYKMKIEVF